MNAVMDHFYSIWHRQPNDRPGLGQRIGKDMMQRFIRHHGIRPAEIVEEVHRVGVMESLDALIEHALDCPCLECTGIQPEIPEEPLDPLSYYQAIIDNGGGIITIGEGLGVFVSPDYTNTPAGWLFVPWHEKLTPEELKHWVDAVRMGRADWPEKERSFR
jgi:hypothetical protein